MERYDRSGHVAEVEEHVREYRDRAVESSRAGHLYGPERRGRGGVRPAPPSRGTGRRRRHHAAGTEGPRGVGNRRDRANVAGHRDAVELRPHYPRGGASARELGRAHVRGVHGAFAEVCGTECGFEGRQWGRGEVGWWFRTWRR